MGKIPGMAVAPPTYRTPQIGDLGDELARQFHEIEACALRGVLTAMREVESYSPLITGSADVPNRPRPTAQRAYSLEWRWEE
jgi:hypothetical protein